MTSTPVSSDVTGIMLGMTSQSVAKERTDSNFSDVLQKQSEAERTKDVPQEKNPVASHTKVEKSNDGKIRDEQDVTPVQTKEVSVEESQENALEEVEELVGQLLVQISEELGMDMEELESLLGDLGMQPTDLLNSENLMQLLLAAGGETDSLSLLTNEKLYMTFQNVSKTLEEGLNEIQKMTGMDVDEIMQLLEKAVSTDEELSISGEAQELTVSEENTEENKVAFKPESNVVTEGAQEDMKVETEKGSNDSPKGGENHFLNGQQSFFTQNLQNSQMAASVENVIPTEGYFSAETQMIMDQIMDFMKVNVSEGLSQLEMQLHPESLGTLQIHIASKEGVVTAHFTTENEVVKEALESQLIQLKDAFKEQGIRVEAIEITVQTHGFERNLEQGRQQSQNESGDRRPQMRVRRLNLRELEDIPTEELTDEERLTAEMMEESGNTVDYTA